MHNQKHLFFLTMFILGLTVSLAQEKHVLIHKEGPKWKTDSDELIFTSHGQVMVSGDSSSQQSTIRWKMMGGDSMRHEFIMDNDVNIELLGDSLPGNVFILKKPHHEPTTARVIIKKSGFLRKNKIVIDYDPRSLEIFKVVDNDEEIPSSKFHKYRDYLEESTEYAELEALHPRMEELEFRIQMDQSTDSAKLQDLTILLKDLQTLKSDRAHVIKQQYSTIKRVIELDELEEAIQTILSDAGLKPPQKIKHIAIRDGKFFLNDGEIKGEVGQKCIQAYVSQSDLTLEDLKKKGDEISIEIRLD